MLKPLGDRVVLKIEEEQETTVGGFVLASAAQDKPQHAEVIAVGTGLRTLNGDLIEPAVSVGDRVVFEKMAGTTIKDGEEEFLVVHESDIIAIVE